MPLVIVAIEGLLLFAVNDRFKMNGFIAGSGGARRRINAGYATG